MNAANLQLRASDAQNSVQNTRHGFNTHDNPPSRSARGAGAAVVARVPFLARAPPSATRASFRALLLFSRLSRTHRSDACPASADRAGRAWTPASPNRASRAPIQAMRKSRALSRSGAGTRLWRRAGHAPSLVIIKCSPLPLRWQTLQKTDHSAPRITPS